MSDASESDQTADGRRHTRISYEVAVTLASETNFYTGFTSDISAGGVFVTTVDLLPIGTPVEFELTLAPQAIRVPVRGIVRWLREPDNDGELPSGFGIEFIELHPRLRDQINAFIEQRGDSLFFEAEEE